MAGGSVFAAALALVFLLFASSSGDGNMELPGTSSVTGFADIVGRRYGSLKLPFNTKKSWIGSIATFISGFLLSTVMLFYFSCPWLDIQVSWEMVHVALAATSCHRCCR